MSEVIIALVGIAGTVAAVAITTWANNKSLNRSHARLADEARREAIGSFATEIMEYRRVQLRLWHEATERIASDAALDRGVLNDVVPSAEDSRRCRAETRSALYKVRLLWADRDILDRADHLFENTTEIESALDKDVMKQRRQSIDSAISDFIDAARTRLSLDPRGQQSK